MGETNYAVAFSHVNVFQRRLENGFGLLFF
jgi:hypothetical protein